MFDDFEIENQDIEASSSALKPPVEASECWGADALESHLLALYNARRMPHGLIFSGPKGVGKATFAYRLARFLLNEAESQGGGGLFGPEDDVPATTMAISEDAAAYTQILSGAHLDFKLVAPEEKPGTDQTRDVIDVKQIRKISEFMRMKSSQDGGWRIALIDDADLMNRNAQNALLKILEEPPERTVLILVCHRPGAMLPTIRSRCQLFTFNRLGDEKISEMLRVIKPELTNAELDVILSMANGSLGYALDLIDERAFEVLTEVQDILSAWPKLDWPSIHLLCERYATAKDDVTRPAFKNYMLWLVDECVKTVLNRSFIEADWLKKIKDNNTLETLLNIQDELKAHFLQVETGNLDHMHYYLGAFHKLPIEK